MHDDQHGTAIIAAAALINLCRLTGKPLESLRIVVSGAGAAAIASARMFVSMGIARENIILCDSRGAVTVGRTDLTPEQREFATSADVAPLDEAIAGADVFLGVSKANLLTADMIRSLAKDPLIMALANPDPEISRADALAARPDVIYASGRSDTPNQLNNLLGFPYIFRGALDAGASRIDEPMKLAAAEALAELARRPVPQELQQLLGREDMNFGKEYIIPSPFDPRLRETIPAAVSKAAIKSGAVRKRQN